MSSKNLQYFSSLTLLLLTASRKKHTPKRDKLFPTSFSLGSLVFLLSFMKIAEKNLRLFSRQREGHLAIFEMELPFMTVFHLQKKRMYSAINGIAFVMQIEKLSYQANNPLLLLILQRDVPSGKSCPRTPAPLRNELLSQFFYDI